MNNQKKVCPICGKQMKYIGSNKICENCGYVLSDSSVNISSDRSANISNSKYSDSKDLNATHSSLSYQNVQYSDSSKFNSSNDSLVSKDMNLNEKKVKKNKTKANVGMILLVALLACIPIAGFFTGIVIVTKEIIKEESITNVYNEINDDGDDGFELKVDNKDTLDSNNSNNSSSSNNSNGTNNSKGYPKSQLFIQFVSYVFDKDYEKIKTDDFKKITFLEFGYTENDYLTLNYKLVDGSEGTFYYDAVNIDTSDLSCFKGLEVLHIENRQLEKEDIAGLENLTEIWCKNSLEDIANITNPNQITSVGISASRWQSSLSGVTLFPNLTTLRVDCGYFIEGISGLSENKGIKNLELIDADYVENFSELYDMPELETLFIQSGNLKDIGFVSKMKNLKELTIADSIVVNIDCIGDCKETLEMLNLSFNYDVKNYDVVKSLTNLKALTLYGYASFENDLILPDFSNMKNLKSLAISSYDDISNLEKLTTLEELTLYRTYDECDLSKLTNLKTLNMIDLSLYEVGIEPVTKLTSLEKINLEGSFIWENAEELLNLPNLKEINMSDCTMGFDLNNLKENKSIQVINMNDVILKTLVDNEWDYSIDDENNIDLNEHTEAIFTNYPNITELSLAETMIEDIGFVKELKELRILDITDNYVTDVEPVLEHGNFEALLCYYNPVIESDGEGGVILVGD